MTGRPTLGVFRECLRVAQQVEEVFGATAMVREVRSRFREGAGEKDPVKIAELREDAFRGLNNYMLLRAGMELRRKRTAQERHEDTSELTEEEREAAEEKGHRIAQTIAQHARSELGAADTGSTSGGGGAGGA